MFGCVWPVFGLYNSLGFYMVFEGVTSIRSSEGFPGSRDEAGRFLA